MMNLKVVMVAVVFTAGNFASGLVQAAPPTPASYALCAACHGPDGKGIQMGAMQMAPTLHKSALVNAGDGEILTSIILTGIQKEDQKYLGMMAPLGAALDADKLTEVVNFLRQNLDNDSEAVTKEQVEAWRKKYEGKPAQKRKDLEEKTAKK